MGKILVTGATGNIGSRLVENLKEKNLEVIAGVSSLSKGGRFMKQAIDTTIINFTRPETLETALEGVERLFLLLPLAEPMATWGRQVIAAARQAGVQFILRSSGLGADPDTGYELGKIHGLIDQDLRESGIPFAIIRPNSFMQNYVNFFGAMIRDRQALYLAQGQGRISLIDVRDIAAAAAAILADPGSHRQQAYDLTGPEALTNEEIAGIISRVLGKTVTYQDIDAESYRQGLLSLGVPEWNIRVLESLNRRIKLGLTAEVNSQVRMLTGKTAIPFSRFAEDHSAFWK
jgi:NAD(P)H dehydrogenase (quinone)